MSEQSESSVLFSDLVEKADPGCQLKPVVQYEFSGGRKFLKPKEA